MTMSNQVEIVNIKYKLRSKHSRRNILNVDPKIRSKLHKFLLSKKITPSGYIYEVPLHGMNVFSEHNKIFI